MKKRKTRSRRPITLRSSFCLPSPAKPTPHPPSFPPVYHTVSLHCILYTPHHTKTDCAQETGKAGANALCVSLPPPSPATRHPPALHPHRLPARPPQRGHMSPRRQPHRGFAPDAGNERARGLRNCLRVCPAHTLHAVVAVGVVAAQKGVVPRPGRDRDVEVGVGGAQGGQVGLEEGAVRGGGGGGWSRPSNSPLSQPLPNLSHSPCSGRAAAVLAVG